MVGRVGLMHIDISTRERYDEFRIVQEGGVAIGTDGRGRHRHDNELGIVSLLFDETT